MVIINKSIFKQTFRYSFVVDGGVVGSFLSPFALPGGANVYRVQCLVTTTITGGAGSGVSVGLGSGGSSAAYVAVTPIAGLNAGVSLVNPNVSTGALIAAGGEFASFTIDTDPLTAGVIEITVFYLL